MTSGTYDLNKQIEAARIMLASIADLTAGDPDFGVDAIEGETNLFESIDALVLSIREDETLMHATAALASDLSNRKQRIKSRIDAKRGVIAKAMEVGGIDKRETPAGTVWLKTIPPRAIVMNEADIPAHYWKAADPTLDLSALTAALRANEIVPGATLSNGARTIAIRT